MKRRGWQWEASHVRQLDRLERMLLVLFLAFWWLMHLAAGCRQSGRRERYDRHDRRDKGHLRLGRLYLREMERGGHELALRQCLPLRRRLSHIMLYVDGKSNLANPLVIPQASSYTENETADSAQVVSDKGVVYAVNEYPPDQGSALGSSLGKWNLGELSPWASHGD